MKKKTLISTFNFDRIEKLKKNKQAAVLKLEADVFDMKCVTSDVASCGSRMPKKLTGRLCGRWWSHITGFCNYSN